MNILTLLLRIANSLPHLHWLSLGLALSPRTYGSKHTYASFFQWTHRTSKMFHKLNITDLLENSQGSLTTLTIDLGFLQLNPCWNIDPDVRLIRPSEPNGSFGWTMRAKDGDLYSCPTTPEGRKFQSDWPYISLNI
ncbi:hypothetical protein BT96DRAFT_918598 [Gymnopus androsaceus JB14]|uniref:Uncharacterized protein n=1 Tax=Gymnopus androsaceus JB14 TaxID=1447944 RepID=A0A6A4HUJ7_9AGAR|nr:hypothetical protein BT96DRAFT_918598 [Gymnopus androsaceus JB14]